MPYGWKGVCYSNVNDAVAAFSASLGDVDAFGTITQTSAPTHAGNGLIAWSIKYRPFTATASTTVTGSTQLPYCATPTYSQYPVQSILVPIALFFAAFLGFRSGFRP